jgi:hypothetical protein
MLHDDEADNYQSILASIEECEESDRLTEWESTFLKSIKEQLLRSKHISKRQFDTLVNIEKKRLGK